MIGQLKLRRKNHHRKENPNPTRDMAPENRWSVKHLGMTLSTGMVLSILSSVMVWHHERNLLRSQFADNTEKVTIALQQQIDRELGIFPDLKNFYQAAKQVDEAEFQSFVQSSMSEHGAVQAIGWIPYVSNTPQPQELPLATDVASDSVGDRLHATISPRQTLTSDSQQSLKIAYLASTTHLEFNLGFDFSLLATTISSFQSAKDTGATVLLTQPNSHIATDQLISETPGEFWAIAAIYQKPANFSTVQGRRQNLKGFLLGIFSLKNMLSNLLRDLQQTQQLAGLELLQNCSVVFYTQSSPQNIANYQPSQSPANQEHILAIYEGAIGSWTKNISRDRQLNSVQFFCPERQNCIRNLKIGNQQWLVEFIPTPAYLNVQPASKIWLSLLLCLTATGVFSVVLRSIWLRDRRVQQERNFFSQLDRTLEELKQDKADLERALAMTNQQSYFIQSELQKQLQERSQAYAELQTAHQELIQINSEIMLLGKMSNLLQACLTTEEAHATIAKFMQRLFPDRSGAIYRICDSRNMVESVMTWGENPPKQMMFNYYDCWSLRGGQLHLFDADRRSGLPCKHYQHISTDQCLCIPLIAQGETFGLLHISSDNPDNKFSEAKQKLAMTVAEHTGLALANVKLRETLRVQSIRDPLTGLYNRRYLEEYLEQEIQRSQRGVKPFAVLMIDVDHFKRFNDTFGHEAGDMVLRELGKFLRENVRGSDVACRYGGEELTLILPEVCWQDSEKIAEKIRRGIKEMSVVFRHQSLGGITISIGVAVFPQDGLTGDSLISQADRALYRAKTQGRDRVVLVSKPSTIPPLLKALS